MDGNEAVVKKKSPIVIFVIIAVLLVAGIVIAILAGTPVGSTIVAADIVAFGLFYSISLIQGRGV